MCSWSSCCQCHLPDLSWRVVSAAGIRDRLQLAPRALARSSSSSLSPDCPQGCAKVDLQDDGELVRLDQVNDGHRPAHQNTETSGNEHKSEAPTEGKLMVDCSRRMMGGEEALVDELQKSKVNPVRVIRLAPYRGTTMRRRLERTQRAKSIQRKIEV